MDIINGVIDMKTFFIILGSVIAYFIVCGFVSAFLEKKSIIDDFFRIWYVVLWPIGLAILTPVIIVDFIRSRFGLDTILFKFKKKKG